MALRSWPAATTLGRERFQTEAMDEFQQAILLKFEAVAEARVVATVAMIALNGSRGSIPLQDMAAEGRAGIPKL